MKYLPVADRLSKRIELSETSRQTSTRPGAVVSLLTPLDPLRQAKRLPIRVIKMLTAHTGHLLHPEYLQPLTSAPVSIELDAKKSPLALLAQTCSQIGKPDPPSSSSSSSSKLGSSCSSQGDKEPSSRSSASSLKLGEHRPSLEDKCSFKPYNKGSGDCRRDGVTSSNSSSSSSDKVGFRVPSNNVTSNGSSTTGQQSAYPPHAASPSSRASSSTPPGHTQQQPPHKQSQSSGGQSTSHSQTLPNGDSAHEQGSPTSTTSNNSHPKKDADKINSDSPHDANSSHVRASTNCSNGSSDDGGKASESAQPSLGPGRITPISPYKTSQPLFPLPSSNMGYHGSVVGAYAGYPSQFVPGLDPTKSSLGVGGMGVPGKHPSSSPLTGASPPSFMQGLCRDPYCLSYPSVSHLGGSNCNSCIHDPSSTLKSNFPLVYPSHPLHSLHQSSLSSSVTSSLSHPLYTYGFMLPNDPLPHACNWVSAGGPCDKRFTTSEELLAHLRTHTALPVGMDSKLSSSGPASCHLHLPHQSSPGSMPSSLSLRAPPSLGLARYHPYSKVHLPPGPSSLSLHSLPTTGPYYPHYALYSQRLGSASALGYQ
ncbi:zinc finger protein 703 [Larimichthys crocea]|uniref:zinc finger protein 703 n=1 Tax=Larimichthys crocea TaxID=215358 RepID=UPI000901CB5A|nr:zinc finger protein 703 [Larimichthys crocea]